MKSEILRNPLVFQNNITVWLAVLVIQTGAKVTKIDEFLNHLVTDKATLLVNLPVCVLVVNRL